MKKTLIALIVCTPVAAISQTGSFSRIKPPTSNKLLLEGNGNYVEAKSSSSAFGFIVREYNSSDYGNIEVTNNGLGLGYNTSGSHLQIRPGGNVGIGIDAPDSRMHVRSDGNLGQIHYVATFANNQHSANNTGTGSAIKFRQGWTAETHKWASIGSVAESGWSNKTGLFFATDEGKERMRITNDGMIGVGTTSPQAAFHIKGDFLNGSEKSALLVEGNPGHHASAVVKAPDQNFVSQIEFKNGSNNKSWTFGARNNFDNGNNRLAFYHYNGSQWKNPLNILDNGNVGIGTVSPAQKLDVNGQLALKGHQALSIHANQDVYGHIRVLQNTSSVLQDGMFINFNSTGGANSHLRFYANGTNERMRIDANTGNVGIGTKNPAQNLHIHGNSNYAEPGIKFTTSEGNNGAELRYYGDAGGKYDYQFGLMLNNHHVWRVYLKDSDKNKPRMDFSGKIYAKEVEVNVSGWSDFVFDDDYALPTLETVESFIDQNNHLPGIPSEKELDGKVDLSEMSKLHMQKIEELTLYIIDQNKQILDQNNRIKALEEKLGE